MSTRSNLASKWMPLWTVPAGLLLLILPPLSVSFADETPGKAAPPASEASQARGTDRSPADLEYAKREVQQLFIQLGWAEERLMRGHLEAEAQEQLVEAAKRYHEKAIASFGSENACARTAAGQLRRYREITKLDAKTQSAYWKARSDLQRALDLHLATFRGGRFRKENSVQLTHDLLDAANRIAEIRPDDAAAVQGYLSVAEAFCLREEYDSAREWAEKAEAIACQCDGHQGFRAGAHELLGVILCAEEQYEQAAEKFEEALLILRRFHQGTNSAQYGMCLLDLAFARIHQERYLDAEAHLIASTSIMALYPGFNGCFSGRTLTGGTRGCYEYCRAKAHAAFGEYDEAEAAIARFWKVSYPEDSGIPGPYAEVRELAERVKQQREAEAEVARKERNGHG